MRQRSVRTSSIAALLVLLSFLFMTVTLFAAEDVKSVKGQVAAVAKTIKTITLEHAGKKYQFKYDEKTVFKNITVESVRDLQGQEAIVDYKTVGADNIATLIKLALAELPAGVAEIKTAELAELVKKGDAGNYLLVDTRPAPRYNAGHIPTAVGIPVPTLEKEGEKALIADKNKILIFYCGGPT
ncbi:MAG: rhodanese-like domain-containing protein [Nitrospirae bacterium]|nr:rhodanese-like domain-containing protein [Nitrospirota bacterium]